MKQSGQQREVRRMRFEDIYGRFKQRCLSCDETADLLGASVSTFYRMRGRFEENGLDGLEDVLTIQEQRTVGNDNTVTV